jgi:hypothetical protein
VTRLSLAGFAGVAGLAMWLIATGPQSTPAPTPSPAQVPTPDPIVTIWYRGTPAGTPRQDELAVMRAIGFNSITWPKSQAAGLEAVRTIASDVGLQVIVADAPKAATAESVLTSTDRVDFVVTPQNAGALTPMAWRAVAHGARVIAFDSGAPTGAGLENPDRSLKPWVTAAQGVARQFSVNGRLIQALQPGPGLIMTPEAVPGLDIVMLDADRSWVLIATNTSSVAVTATVRLPTGAPYAIWADLLDNASLAMAGEAAGPRWNLKMDPHLARVYIVDKKPK